MVLTHSSNGRRDETACEDLCELAHEGVRLAGERPLQVAGGVVRQGRRDEEAVEEHLERLGVDLEPRSEFLVQGCILGHTLRGHARKVVAEDVLDKVEDTCTKVSAVCDYAGAFTYRRL